MKNVISQFGRNKFAAIFGVATLLAVSLAAGRSSWYRLGAAPAQNNRGMEATLSGAAAVKQLQQDGSYQSLAAAVNATRYHAQATGKGFAAANPTQQFITTFDQGVQIAECSVQKEEKQAAPPQWQFRLQLVGYGYGDDFVELGEGETTANGERVEMRKSAITEWYVNKPEGLEQGFTLHTPPANGNQFPTTENRLRLSLQVKGDLQAQATNEQSITFKDKWGRPVLSYDHLAAWDANHKVLPAMMKADGDTITLDVDDTNAAYPVTIDPVFTQFAKLTANDGATNDHLGEAVALSGDTALIGAADDNGAFTDQGAAYVFVRNGTTWTQQAKLIANDAKANDHFGNAVAIDGNTAIIGASEAAFNGLLKYGAAYVFTRSGANWTQQAKLQLANSEAQTEFGSAVAVSGNTAAIGAYRENDEFFGADRGAVYVFTRSGTTWAQQARLRASDGAQFDQLGNAVALYGETLLAGAFTASDKGAAYVFQRTGVNWAPQAKLIASDGGAGDFFGRAVALGQDVAVIGAEHADVNGAADQGAAYVYTRSGNVWMQQTKLTASDGVANHTFGRAVAYNGECIAVGAPGASIGGNLQQGAAYVFVRNGTTWGQQQKLTASDGGLQAYFGRALALSDNYLLASAYGANINGATQQGAAYLFQLSRRFPLWDTLTANDGTANDHFGQSLALADPYAVIGAPGEDINGAQDQGAAYVFRREGNFDWVFQQKLTQGAGGDAFGSAVAISANNLLVGAPQDDVFGSVDQGSAYIYVRSGNSWNLIAPLFAADPAAGQRFGTSVGLYVGRAVIGAPYATISVKANQGAAYVFLQSGTNVWTQQQKLTANDGQAQDYFARDVAVDGSTVLASAHRHQIGGNAEQGAAYVFLVTGSVWSQQAKLSANDGAANDRFGSAVALSGETALIGAEGDDPSGAAYVFTRTGVTWAQQTRLKASDESNAFARFGGDVALAGDVAGVSAWLNVINGQSNQGAAYVFTRSSNVWAQQQKLLLNNGAAGDEFGYAIAADNSPQAVLASSIFRNSGQGAAYYFLDRSPLAIVPATLPAGTAGAAYNQSLTSSIGIAPYALFVSNGALPPGLSLTNDGSGFSALSGTPTQAGVYNFTVGVNDAQGGYGTQSYTLTINCQTITVNPVNAPESTANAPYTQTFTQTGAIAPVTFTLVGILPNGMSFNPGNNTLSGTPAQTGTFNFTVTVTGANGCQGVRNYTLMVKQAVCPTITLNPATLPAATVGTAYNQQLSTTGGVAPYSYKLGPNDTLPQGVSLVNGALTGMPMNPTLGHNFTIATTDANGCLRSRGYVLTVNSQACPTILMSPTSLPAGTVGTAFAQSLSASGGTAPYTYSVSAGALPAGLTLNSNGSLSGTPDTSGLSSLTVKVTDANGCQGTQTYALTIAPALVVSVSAASYLPGAAPESIVAAFGVKLSSDTKAGNTQPLPTTLANVMVIVKDSFGVERPAPLFFVSPGQINYQVPPGTALGKATVSVINDNALTAAGTLEIASVAPGLFTANANGQGVVAAVALRIKGDGTLSYEPVAQMKNNQFVTMPIDLGPQSDQVFLVLYGTGLRYRQNLSLVTATLGGNVTGDVIFAGAAPGFTGLDQVNVRIPRTLIGRNEIDLALMVEGKAANVVRVNIQ